MQLTVGCGVQTMGSGKTLQVHPPRLSMCMRLLQSVPCMLDANSHPRGAQPAERELRCAEYHIGTAVHGGAG